MPHSAICAAMQPQKKMHQESKKKSSGGTPQGQPASTKDNLPLIYEAKSQALSYLFTL